ncbi:MAG: hypothetical protein RLZZ188_3270 [Verrucomicrobiota bacterium]
MNAPLIPTDDARRVAELRSYGVLDTPAEREFDDFTAIASRICGAPISLISLIDTDRQWFKSRVGIEVEQTPREVAFCAHAILEDGVTEVPDAAADPRFEGNPFVVGAPGIRFYAGAPLRTASGHRLGTLCVIDRRPRELTVPQREALEILSRRVVAQLELRRLSRQRELDDARAWERHLAALDATTEGIALFDGDGHFTYVNRAFARLFDHERALDLIGRNWRILHDEDELRRIEREVTPIVHADGRWSGRVRSRRRDGTEFTEELTLSRTPETGFIRVSRVAASVPAGADLAAARSAAGELAALAAQIGSVHAPPAPETLRTIGALARGIARTLAAGTAATGEVALKHPQ